MKIHFKNYWKNRKVHDLIQVTSMYFERKDFKTGNTKGRRIIHLTLFNFGIIIWGKTTYKTK